MCGIGGEFRFDGTPPDMVAGERRLPALASRGPDGEGRWQQGPAALVHRRLRIIDLSDAGAQPMVDDELGLAVVFNGCIYNYRELRDELIAAGYSFTLYLIHYTVMYSAKSAFKGEGLAWFLFAVATSNVLAFLIASPFEMKHKQFAEWLISLAGRLREKRSTEAASSPEAH
jgi:glutamate synthase domain-containing protein 1